MEFDAAGGSSRRCPARWPDARKWPLLRGPGLSRDRFCWRDARFLADAVQDFAAAADGDVFRLEAVLHIHADLGLGHVATHVPATLPPYSRAREICRSSLAFAGDSTMTSLFAMDTSKCVFYSVTGAVEIGSIHSARRFYYYSPKFQHCQVGIELRRQKFVLPAASSSKESSCSVSGRTIALAPCPTSSISAAWDRVARRRCSAQR